MATPTGPRVAFLLSALIVVAGLIVAGRQLYAAAAGPPVDPFLTKLAELTLQLAVVVVVGALLKELVDWSNAHLQRRREAHDARLEFLKRIRAAHVEVEYARDLLNAHRSGKTYGERLRRLILLRAEIAEIIEDLKASTGLFAGQTGIVEALEGIVAYLEDGRREYIERHDDVSADAKAARGLDVTMRDKRMVWLEGFMAAGAPFKEGYEANLDRSKGVMRRQVYGR